MSIALKSAMAMRGALVIIEIPSFERQKIGRDRIVSDLPGCGDASACLK
jgi:hypothetical protein